MLERKAMPYQEKCLAYLLQSHSRAKSECLSDQLADVEKFLKVPGIPLVKFCRGVLKLYFLES